MALAGWRVWTSRTAAPDIAATRSIAVLPFQALNAPGEDALCLGLADAVITKLSNVRRLAVRPTNSILKYAGAPADPQAIAHELDVEALLQGSLQKAGDRIRVTVQLVRASDQRPLWAETFDAGFTGIFAIEDAISEKVAQALAVKLAPGEKQRVDRLYTANLDAYRSYLDGRFAGFQFTPDGLNRAIAYFERAIAIDPGYALAYAGLADAYTTASDWVLPPREALPKAEAAARRAISIDDELAEAHAALGHAQMHGWKMADAESQFTRALALNPNMTSVYFAYGEYLAAAGRQDQAVAEMRKGLKIDPYSAELLLMVPFALYLKHDFPAAEAAGNLAVKVHPDFWALYMGLGYGLMAANRFPESIAAFEKGRTLNPYATINLSGSGCRPRPRRTARTGDGRGSMPCSPCGPNSMWRLSISPWSTMLWVKRSLDWLDKAYADQSEMMLFLDIYPPLADLKSSPRFADFVRRVGVIR